MLMQWVFLMDEQKLFQNQSLKMSLMEEETLYRKELQNLSWIKQKTL